MVDETVAVRGVAAAFLAVATVAVVLRCYVRLRIVKAFGWDDLVMILSMLFYIMFCGCMIGGSLHGTGKHLVDLTPRQRTIAMEYWFLCDIGYAIASILCKLSVAIFLLRVMVLPLHRQILYAVTAFTIITNIVFFIIIVVQCSPVSYFWTRMGGEASGKCGYVEAIIIMLYIFSAISAIFDFMVGILPIFLVRNLQMSVQAKAAVAGLLGMACIASLAIIIRIPFVQTIRDEDFLYATVQIAIWSNIETGLAITAGSLATIRPLFRILHSHTSSSYRVFDSGPQSKKHLPLPLADFESNLQGTALTRHHRSKSNPKRTHPGTSMSTAEAAPAQGSDFWGVGPLPDPEDPSRAESKIGVHRTFEVSTSKAG